MGNYYKYKYLQLEKFMLMELLGRYWPLIATCVPSRGSFYYYANYERLCVH